MNRNSSRFNVSSLSQSDLSPFVFLLFFVTGSLLIAVAKLFSFHVGFMIAIPVIIIFGYTLVSWFLPRFELRRDQIGDNLYYMGFLLTLVSLTVTLIQYSNKSDEDFIVSNFGIALVATIVGILGRTVLNQFRKDVIDIEKEIQFNLSKASLKLKGQMFAAVEDFASFQRQMAQVTEESAQNIADAHKALATGLSESVEEIVASLRNQVDDSAGVLSQKSDQVILELSKATEDLIKEINRQKIALSGLVESTEEAADLSSLSIDTSPLREVESSLSELKDSLNSKLVTLNDDMSIQTDAFNKSFSKFSETLESFSLVMDERLTELNPGIEQLSEYNSKIDEFMKRVENMKTADKWKRL